MQIGIVAKKIGLSVHAIRFYERNGLLPRSAENAGRFPPISRHRLRNRCLCSSCAGVGIHTQRDSRPAETARESLAALCTGTAAPSRRARRCAGRLRDLQKLEHELRSALRSCNKELRKADAHCPILRQNPHKPESEN